MFFVRETSTIDPKNWGIVRLLVVPRGPCFRGILRDNIEIDRSTCSTCKVQASSYNIGSTGNHSHTRLYGCGKACMAAEPFYE